MTAQSAFLTSYYAGLNSYTATLATASVGRSTAQAQATADYYVNQADAEADLAEANNDPQAPTLRAKANAFAAFATTYVGYMTTATQTAATIAVAESANENAASLATVTAQVATSSGEINSFYAQQITDAATPPPMDNDANDDGIPDAPTRSATEVMSSYVEGVRAQRATDQAGVQSSFSDLVDRRTPITTSTMEYSPGQYPITYTEMSSPYSPTATPTLPVTGPISSAERDANYADETLERPAIIDIYGRICIEGCHGAPSHDLGPTLDFSKALEEALGTKKPSPPLTPAQQKELEDQIAAIKEYMEKPQPEPPERDFKTGLVITIVIPAGFDETGPDRYMTFDENTNWSVIKTTLESNPDSYMEFGDLESIIGIPPELVPFIRNSGAVVAATKPDPGAEFRAAQQAYESTIFWGQVQTAGGIASTVGAGLFLASNPAGWLTIIVGGGGLLLGVDQTQAGARQSVTGEVTHTFTNETLVKFGLTREQADWVEFGIGLGLSISELAIIAKAAATREAAELAVRELAEQQSKSADEVAKLTKEVGDELSKTSLDAIQRRGFEIAETSPIQIPGNARIRFRAGDEFRYSWIDDTGREYLARFHSPSKGAPAGSKPSWVIERAKPGSPKGIPRVAEIYIGDGIWIDMKIWKSYVIAFKNGTATEGMKNILRRGHFEVD